MECHHYRYYYHCYCYHCYHYSIKYWGRARTRLLYRQILDIIIIVINRWEQLKSEIKQRNLLLIANLKLNHYVASNLMII
jgi:hypothetical protein